MATEYVTRRHDTSSGIVLETKTHETALDAILAAEDANRACIQVGYSPDTVPLLIETSGLYTLEVDLEGGKVF